DLEQPIVGERAELHLFGRGVDDFDPAVVEADGEAGSAGRQGHEPQALGMAAEALGAGFVPHHYVVVVAGGEPAALLCQVEGRGALEAEQWAAVAQHANVSALAAPASLAA